MARKKTTVYLDDEVLRGARVAAARSGRRDSDVIEEALRRFLGLEALRAAWSRNELPEDDALALADRAVHETRRPR